MSEIPRLLRYHAESYKLDLKICAALVCQESSGDVWAFRVEEKGDLHDRIMARTRSQLSGWKPKAGENPSLYDEKLARCTSYGLTQILGETARVMGFSGRYLTELINPPVNLFFGLGYLSRCMRRASSEIEKNAQYRSALLFYNGGGDPLYPDKILDRVASGEADRFLSS